MGSTDGPVKESPYEPAIEDVSARIDRNGSYRIAVADGPTVIPCKPTTMGLEVGSSDGGD